MKGATKCLNDPYFLSWGRGKNLQYAPDEQINLTNVKIPFLEGAVPCFKGEVYFYLK